MTSLSLNLTCWASLQCYTLSCQKLIVTMLSTFLFHMWTYALQDKLCAYIFLYNQYNQISVDGPVNLKQDQICFYFNWVQYSRQFSSNFDSLGSKKQCSLHYWGSWVIRMFLKARLWRQTLFLTKPQHCLCPIACKWILVIQIKFGCSLIEKQRGMGVQTREE